MIPSALTKDKVRCYKDDHSKIKGFPIFFFYTTNDVLSAVMLLKQRLCEKRYGFFCGDHKESTYRCKFCIAKDLCFPDLASNPVRENKAVRKEVGLPSSLTGDSARCQHREVSMSVCSDGTIRNFCKFCKFEVKSKPSEGDADRVRDLDSSSSGGDKTHPKDCQCDSPDCENCNRQFCDIVGCDNIALKDQVFCDEHKKVKK